MWYLQLVVFLFVLADVYDNFKRCVNPDKLNVTTRILGGGWLEHGEKSIHVEGASVVSQNLLKVILIIHITKYFIHRTMIYLGTI